MSLQLRTGLDQAGMLAKNGIVTLPLFDYDESSSKSVAMVTIGKNNFLCDRFKGMKPKC